MYNLYLINLFPFRTEFITVYLFTSFLSKFFVDTYTQRKLDTYQVLLPTSLLED